MRTVLLVFVAVIVIGGAAWGGLYLRSILDRQAEEREQRHIAREEAEARRLNEQLADPWSSPQPPRRTRRNR